MLLKEAWRGHRRRTGMQLSLGSRAAQGGQAAKDLDGAARGLRPRVQGHGLGQVGVRLRG